MKRNSLILFYLLCVSFTIYSCSKELSYENSINTISAQGNLRDTLNNCLPDSVHGTFYNGITPGSDTAYIEIQVNVTSEGNYIISTDLQNGFMFADSGYFTSIGINTVQLKPSGTPILIQPTTFTVTFDSTVCNFTINVKDSTGIDLGDGGTDSTIIDSTNTSDSAWIFSVDANTYHGSFETVHAIDTFFVDTAMPGDTSYYTYYELIGTSAVTGDTAFATSFLVPQALAVTGTYSTGASEAALYLSAIIFPSTPVTIYQADGSTAGLGTTTITIDSFDSSTGIISGLFNGIAKDQSGNAITIVNGSFKAKLE